MKKNSNDKKWKKAKDNIIIVKSLVTILMSDGFEKKNKQRKMKRKLRFHKKTQILILYL